MKKKLVIFGVNDYAKLAHFYFSTYSNYEVAGFTVDSAYQKVKTLCDLPVIAFEEISKCFSPKQCDMFVAIGYSQLNANRKEKYIASKALGYKLASFISSNATILNDGQIGENCFILENNTIQPFVTIGNNVTMWSGNHIGHHSSIKDHCFISSHVVVSGGVQIGEQCFIGVNATLRDYIKIGNKCVIGAGALILADAEPEGVYISEVSKRAKVPSSRLRGI